MSNPPKLPKIAALTDINFDEQHDELVGHMEALTALAMKAGPDGVAAVHALSRITNLFANLSARVQILEDLARRDGKYPTEYE